MRSTFCFALTFATACAATPSTMGDAGSDSPLADATTPDAGAGLDAGGGAPDTPPLGLCGGSLGQSDECEACMNAMCCAQKTTCHATAGCRDVFTCLHGCSGDADCWRGCLDAASAAGSVGVAESSMLDGCIFAMCPPGCRS